MRAVLNQKAAACKLSNAMTVRDLILHLNGMDEDALVVFQSNYGDRARTQQLTAVASAEEYDNGGDLRVYETAYSDSGLAVDEADEEEDTDRPELKLVILQ